MFESFWKDIKYKAETGNMVTRLVIANVAVFLAVNLVFIGFSIFAGESATAYYSVFLKWISLSSDVIYTLTHIWVIFTHMFVHEGFLHLLFNMLYLYWFGNILGDLIGDKKILPLYLLGGLMGGLVYMLSASYLGAGGIAVGASAAGLAIVVAAAMVNPEYNMRLLFLGDVKLKWIALVVVMMDLVALATPGSTNSGGHAAHLGGAFMGYLFITNLNAGRDWSIPINNFIKKIKGVFSGNKLKVAYKKQSVPSSPRLKKNQRAHAVSDNRATNQDQVDAILDKIKLKGYDSLSASEKKFLADTSKK